MSVLINVPGGESVAIGIRDAESLSDALWAVSATAGAAVLVGKLRHAVGSGSGEVEVDEDERAAMLAALDQASTLTPELEDLRWVVGGDVA